MLDVTFNPIRVSLVPIPGDNTNSSVFGPVSTAGFGGDLGRAIGIMDQDGRCRMATAIRAKDGDPTFALPAKGVLLRFAIGLTNNPAKGTMTPTVNIRYSGLVTANDEMIHDSIIHTKMGKLVVE